MIKKVIILLAVMFVFTFLALIGMNPSFFMSNAMTMLTLFVLPWIILYWIIRAVKALEDNK